MADAAITGRHAIQHQGLELFLPLRVLRQPMHRHRAAQTLPEQHQRFAFDLGRVVEPGERGVDVLVDRRQARLAFGQTVAAIVDQQDLIAVLRQPPAAAQMHRQIAAVAVQMQDRAFDLDARFGRQPPGVEFQAISGEQGDGAVFEFGFVRGEDLARFRVEQ